MGKAKKDNSPRTVMLRLTVDQNGKPEDAASVWHTAIEKQSELRRGQPLELDWRRAGRFSTLRPGDRAFLLATHNDNQLAPGDPPQRAIIGYGQVIEPSYRKENRNGVKLSLQVALKPHEALPKAAVEETLRGVILWDQSNGKEIKDHQDIVKLTQLWEKHLKEIGFHTLTPTSLNDRTEQRGQPDPERRKLVEENAVKLVWDYFKCQTYRVHNRQNDNCGWDLTVVRGDEELKLEVKGLSGTDLNADLTVNEFEKMRSDEHRAAYRICVVLDALNPSVDNLYVIRYDPASDRWLDQHSRTVDVQPRTAARLMWLVEDV